MVWGNISKTAISQSFIKGSKRAIYQMKGYFFLFEAYRCNQNYFLENID